MLKQLLARSAKNIPGVAVETVCRPAREAGADFYRTQLLDDGSLLVTVGDISGKGLNADIAVPTVERAAVRKVVMA